MLTVYCGRESEDREQLLADKLAETLHQIRIGQGSALSKSSDAVRAVVIVPDQYTLQAERELPGRLGVPGFLDAEILSLSRLSHKVLGETGGATRVSIDQYGRQMLLAKILSDEAPQLTVFSGMEKHPSFIELTEALISEFKQYHTDASTLRDLLPELTEQPMLKRKLEDICRIMTRYETEMQGQFCDAEDLIALFLNQMKDSVFIKESVFFVYGFETLNPLKLAIIKNLETYGVAVQFFHSCKGEGNDDSLFSLPDRTLKKLVETIGKERVTISKEKATKRAIAEPIAHIERMLFANPFVPFIDQQESVVLCKAANFYSEAETAAAYLLDLVREKGLRYREIAVICNDLEKRGTALKRVFEECKIPFFLSAPRTILHHPISMFVSSLLDLVTEKWRFEDVFLLLKTDLTPIEQADYELLEDYTTRFRIRGSGWKKAFCYGRREMEEETFTQLEASRVSLVAFLESFETEFLAAKSAAGKTQAVLSFLNGPACLPAQVSALASEQQADGFQEDALATLQILEKINNLLLQLQTLLGETTISGTEFAMLMKTGLANLELGVIPPTVDQVLIGDLQRVMLGKIKALLVIGVNDGVLPALAGQDDLLSIDERTALSRLSPDLCKEDDLIISQERFAIYKNFSKAEQTLFLSCSSADGEGKEIRPSFLFQKMQKLFPDTPVQKDIHNREELFSLVETPASTLRFLTGAVRQCVHEGEALPPVLASALQWHQKNDSAHLAQVTQGFFYRHPDESLPPNQTRQLYERGNEGDEALVISPSRIEKFSRCPFAHWILYGLRPDERRIFEVSGREVGDIYHESLMRLARDLTIPGTEITSPDSPWMSLSEEACKEKIYGYIDHIAAEYREGLLHTGMEERYRAERMKEVCAGAAYALVEHVRQGKVKALFFEESFGTGNQHRFPAIEVSTSQTPIRIEGKIDRADLLEDGFLKIIDYKSGHETFSIREAKGGFRLQLMLYLKAAAEGLATEETPIRPAGVFYFEIAETLVDATALDPDTISTKMEAERKKRFRLDGIVVNEEKVIRDIAGEFSGYSEILPLYRNKEGLLKGTGAGKLLEKEEFEELQAAVDETVRGLCEGLSAGRVTAHPKKNGNETACDFCGYKSICNFELSFDGCSYDVVI